MKQNKRFKQDFIINKDYTPNQNLSKNYDNLNEINHQDFVSKKTNKLKFARIKSESTFEFRVPQAKNSYGGFKQKNRTHKFAKIFAGVSLATLIICGTVLGFAPLVSSGMSSNSSTSSSMSATAGAENTQDLKTHVAEYKADIESGKIKYAPSALGLDPANDPVLFTTESGLEIKMSNANPTVNHNGSFANSALNGYMYLTMGSYNGYAINWLITAFSNKPPESTTPAGALLTSLVSKHAFLTSPAVGTNGLYCDATLAPGNFRLVSECVLGTTMYVQFKYGVSDNPPAGWSMKHESYQYTSCIYYCYHGKNNLTNYINNNTLSLASYVENLFITTNLHYLSETQANLLLSREVYSIGTDTVSSWWFENDYKLSTSSASKGTNYVYSIAYFNENGEKASSTVGSYRYYDASFYDTSFPSIFAGIRPGLVVKLL